MRLAAGERDPDVDHRVAGAAAGQLRADPLLDARDELPGHDAADHPLGELEAGAAGERLDLDLADGVLPVATGLLDVPARARCPAPARVSRSGTRTSTCRTETPNRSWSRSSAASACASPIVHSTSCSLPMSTRSDGSSAASRLSAVESLSSSDLVAASIATGSSGVGSDHGRSTRGSSTEERVSPVSARVSRPTVAMSPHTTRLAGWSCWPNG